MTTEAHGTAAPAVTETPAAAPPAAAPAAPPAAPAPPAQPAADTSTAEPQWLPARIEQAKRSAMNDALKALGAASIDDAKALIEKARQLEEASKTESEKVAAKLAKLQALEEQNTRLTGTIAIVADSALAALTAPQRDAVLAITGGNKGLVIETIEKLRPTWAMAAPAPAAPVAAPIASASPTAPTPAEPPKPLPVPANSAANTAPPPAAGSPQVDHKATWEALKQTNPFEAAIYLNSHAAQIFANPK